MKNLKRYEAAIRGGRKRSRHGRGRQRSRHYRCLLEVFESRLLLSAAPSSIGADLETGEGESLDGNSSLSGYVYLDTNGNGLRDADDVGVPGTLITLTGSDDAGEPINRTAITLDPGFYEFDNLPQGTYQISQTQPQALLDGPESTSIPNVVTEDDQFSEVALGEELTYVDNNFAEASLLPQYMSIVWFFASSSPSDVFREMVARGEEQAGNLDLAAAIRAGDTDLEDDTNRVPSANADFYEVGLDEVLDETVATGVLANDTDADGQALTATLVDATANGELSFRSDGSFTYTPNVGFIGTDQFTYTARDSSSTSNTATVTITVGENTFNVNENALAGTEVGSITAPSGLGATLLYEFHDPNVAADLNLVPDDHLSGDPTAAVVLIEYLDFQSLASAALHPTVQQLEQEFSDSLLVVRRHLPLDSIELHAFDAARAAEAAGRQGMFEEMGDLLFENQSQWKFVNDPQPFFETYATDLGLDLGQFLDDLDNPAIADRITRDLDAADRLGADATPTLFLNGEQIETPGSFEKFEQLIQEELAELEEPFAVHRQTGDITVTGDAILDFETSPSFARQVAVTDLDGVREVVDIVITVVDLNESPVAADDSYDVDQDTVLEIDVSSGTLINDSDDDGDVLTSALVTGPANGQLELNDDGSFTYTPNASFSGTDTFTYQADDGSLSSATVTVTIEVNDVNQTPVSVPDEYEVDEDGVLLIDAVAGVLANDSDANEDLLEAVLVTTTSNGSLTLDPDGSFVYTPNANFNGSDEFTYFADDGSIIASAEATVTITVNPVNDQPVSLSDAYETDEDNVLTVNVIRGLLLNDTDADGDLLTVTLADPPTNGNVALNSDGSFTYTPNADFFGIDEFTYTASDGPAFSLATSVTVDVIPMNDDVPMSLDDVYDVPVDGILVIEASHGVLANDDDVDGDSLSATLVTSPTGGTVTLNGDGSFSYTPDPSFHDIDVFAYVANDGTANGNESTVTIRVNSAANGVDDAYEVDEDNVLDVDSAVGLLANDSDADGDTLTIALFTEAIHGTVSENADGSFSYVPDPDYHGTDTFRYTISDGFVDSVPINVEITVNPVNDAPVGADDVFMVPVNGELIVAATGGVLANDSDADGEALAASVKEGPTRGNVTLNEDGSFTYTPNPGFHGIDSFTYEASDGSDSSESTVSIEVNTLPEVVGGTFEIDEDTVLAIGAPGVLINGDVDRDELTISLIQVTTNGNLMLNTDGSFDYTPNAHFHGSDSFTYVLNDGFRDSAEAAVTIIVKSVNDLPEVTDDAHEVDEDVTLDVDVATGVLANDRDVEGDPLTVSLVQAPAHGSLTLNPNGSFSYAPNANFNGSDEFTYVANDGFDDSAEATVKITVIPVNDLPVTESDSYETDEDVPLEIDAVSGVLDNDSDPDSQLLVSAVQMPADGSLTLNPDGSFVYTPDANFFGLDSFTYVVNDGFVDSAETTVLINVLSVNDLPQTMVDEFTLDADSVLERDVTAGLLANDSDVESILEIDSERQRPPLSGGELKLFPNGAFTYTPNVGFRGFDYFTYQATDGTVLSDPTLVTIEVVSERPIPQAVDDTFEVVKNGTLVIESPLGILANDIDPEGDTLTAILFTRPANGTFDFLSDGTFIYTPIANFSGTDSFVYFATDFTSSSAFATVTINVVEQDAAEGELAGLPSIVDLVFADEDWSAI